MKALRTNALAGLAFALYSTTASAQLTNQGMLDQVVTEFATRASAWQTVVMNAAMFLFWTLGTISLVVTFGFMALRKADLGDFFAEFIRFILFFGLFLWLLRNGPDFAISIVRSLSRLGEQASGISSVTPSGIVDIGFLIWKQAITGLSYWSPFDSAVSMLLSAGILIMLALVAVNMLLLLVSAWLLSYAGIFFLGFGGSRWTSDMAINYYKTILGVAVQIMTMVLLVGIGNDLLSSFYAKMNKGLLNFEELGVMLVFCLTLLMLVNRIPPLVAGVISGSGIGNAGGIGSFGAGSVVGAAMGAASVAAGAAGMVGSAVMSGAANIAGGASAVKAAFEKAQASASSESGAGQDLLGSMGSASTSNGQTSAGEGPSPFAQAAGFGGGSGGGTQAERAASAARAASGENGRTEGKGGTSTADASNRADKAAKSEPKPTGSVGPGQQTAPGSIGAGGLAHAATLAASTTAELAKGAGAVLRGKLEQLADNAQDRIDRTIGGQVAAAIRADAASEAVTFGANSLGGEQSTDAKDEVAAFVNRSRPA